MRSIFILTIAIIILGIYFPTGATVKEQPELPKYSTTVQLNISSAEDEIKNMVYSYISRELRSLGDVTLVEKNPKWVIQIVAMRTQNKAGIEMGVAFSVVIERRSTVVEGLLVAVKTILPTEFSKPPKLNLKEEEIEVLRVTKLHDDLVKAFTLLTANLTEIRDHQLLVGSIDDVQRLCQGIVVDFDATQLKQERKWYKEFIDEQVLPLLKENQAKDNNSESM